MTTKQIIAEEKEALATERMCNQCRDCCVENTSVLDCADDDCYCHTLRYKRTQDWLSQSYTRLLEAQAKELMERVEKMRTPEQKTSKENLALIDYGFQMAQNHTKEIIRTSLNE